MVSIISFTSAEDAKAWLLERGPKYGISFVRVSPEVASAWLTLNTRNRKAISSRVVEWSGLMGAGRWIAEANSIDFGADGTLFNGQHRLMAVVLGKHTVTMMVRRNCAEELLGALDTGETRSAAQVLQIEKGIATTKRVRAAVMVAHALVTTGRTTKMGRVTAPLLESALVEFGSDFRAVYSAMNSDSGRMSNSGLLGSMTVARRANESAVQRFAVELREGTNLQKGSPVLVLRDYLIGLRDCSGGVARDEVSRVTFAALDAYVKGEVRRFVRSSNETARESWIAAWKRSRAR